MRLCTYRNRSESLQESSLKAGSGGRRAVADGPFKNSRYDMSRFPRPRYGTDATIPIRMLTLLTDADPPGINLGNVAVSATRT